MAAREFGHACVVGLGWGDEGKGKVVDLLCGVFDAAVRFNGGANAGHTVCVAGERFALHLIPSSVIHADKPAVIGPGVALDPLALVDEIQKLEGRGLHLADRLFISDRAHLVMPWHKVQDRLSESAAGSSQAIGTTARGIGPCYADKMIRSTALRAVDLLDEENLQERVAQIANRKVKVLRALHGDDGGLNARKIMADLQPARDRLAPMIRDTSAWLHEQVEAGKTLLFEGANGMLLDVDHGTYPYVTSSSTGPQGVAAGAGVSPGLVSHRIGVTKAYSTRVGHGPFPTELADAVGNRIREQGREYGTTTGRPRRCGWLDAVALRANVQLGGITEVAVTHLDTLAGFDKVGICVGYRRRGKTISAIPASASQLAEVEPVLEMHPGWEGPIRDVDRRELLPSAARAYLSRLEELLGTAVTIVSLGPDRHQTLVCDPKWSESILAEGAT